MEPVFHCSMCGDPIDPGGPNTYQKVEGWERPGRGLSGRSGSSLVLRHLVEEWACSACIAAAKAGVARGQMTLG